MILKSMILKGVKSKTYEKWKWERSMRMRIALDPIVNENLSLGYRGEDGYRRYGQWASWSRNLGIYKNE